MHGWGDWVHVMFSAYGQWLPGDVRGFRDHDHRVHSSGDYKNPPPPEEHAGLRRYAKSITGTPVRFPSDVRGQIAEALGAKFLEMDAPARIIAVAATHVHALVRVGVVDAEPLVGRAKQFASHQVRNVLPGRIWGQSCHPVRIKGEGHYREAVAYIERHRADGAAVWIHPDLRERTRSGPAST